jgi:multidrug efflux pump subunit AcrB
MRAFRPTRADERPSRRQEHKSPEEAIYATAVLRFRPIMMDLAAVLGTVPIAIGFGAGADLRQPLGVAIVGGLVVSRALTLFTIPVADLFMERFSDWVARPPRRLPVPTLADRRAAE